MMPLQAPRCLLQIAPSLSHLPCLLPTLLTGHLPDRAILLGQIQNSEEGEGTLGLANVLLRCRQARDRRRLRAMIFPLIAGLPHVMPKRNSFWQITVFAGGTQRHARLRTTSGLVSPICQSGHCCGEKRFAKRLIGRKRIRESENARLGPFAVCLCFFILL